MFNFTWVFFFTFLNHATRKFLIKHMAHIIISVRYNCSRISLKREPKTLVLLHFTYIHFPLTLVIEDWLKKKEQQRPTKDLAKIPF